MKIEIVIFNDFEVTVFNNLVNELKSKQATITRERMFQIELELNIKSFDDIIYLLEKYNNDIEIELSIHSVDNVVVYISREENTCSLGNQVE